MGEGQQGADRAGKVPLHHFAPYPILRYVLERGSRFLADICNCVLKPPIKFLQSQMILFPYESWWKCFTLGDDGSCVGVEGDGGGDVTCFFFFYEASVDAKWIPAILPPTFAPPVAFSLLNEHKQVDT